MALEDQIVDLPITGGVNQKNDQVLTTLPTVVVNRAYRKNGALQRRYGYNCIGPYNLRAMQGATTTAPATPDKLAVLNSELLRIGGGQLDTYELNASVGADWVNKGAVPACVVTREAIASAPSAAASGSMADLGLSNGQIVSAYTVKVANLWRVVAEVKDATNGGKIAALYTIARTTTSSYANVQVYVFGNYVTVFYTDPTASILYAASWNTVAQAWGAAASVQTGVMPLTGFLMPAYAVAPKTTASFSLAWSNSSSGSANSIGLASFTITSGVIALASTATSVGGADVPTSLQLLTGASDTCLAYGIKPAGITSMVVSALTTSTLALLNRVATLADTGTGSFSKTWIVSLSANNYLIGSTDNDRSTVFTSNTTGTGGLTEYASFRDTVFVSKAFGSGISIYAHVITTHSVIANQFLIDVANNPGFIHAAFAPTQTTQLSLAAPVTNASSQLLPTLTTPVSRAASDVLVSTVISGQGNGSPVNVGARYRFDRQTYNTHAQVNGVLLLGGGVPSVYDGSSVAEASFLSYPDPAKAGTLTAAGAAGFLSAGSYGYQFVFVRQDAAGNIYRSAPSGAVTVTASATNTVTGKVPMLRLTNAPQYTGTNGFLQPAVGVEIYRTAVNGATYYYLTTVPVDVAGDPPTFTDGVSDATITSHAQLYTTGGELPNTTLPSCAQVYSFKGGAFLGASDDDSLWIAKSLITGVGPSFTASLTIPPFGPEPVSALFSIDTELIIAKPSALYYLLGDAPAPNGATTLGNPQPISAAVGCLDPWSVVPYAEGVAFLSDAGLVNLGRSLAITRFGKAVEDTIAPATQFAGAFMVRTLDTLRFAMRGAPGTGNIVAYDLFQSRDASPTAAAAPVWTVDSVYDVISAVPGNICGTAIWKDQYVWISATGHLFVEVAGTWLDTSGFTAPRWIDTHFRTGAEKAKGPQSYQRVRRLGVLGQQMSAHGMSIAVVTDRGNDTYTWSDLDVSGFSNLPNERFRAHLASPPQKSSRIYIDVVDSAPTTFGIGTGEGFTLQSVAIEVGLKEGLQRTGQSHKR